MKTLTIKTAQNIPIHSSYIIEVDGKNIGSVKPGSTEYFEIREQAKNLTVRTRNAESKTIEISEDRHHLIIINTKRKFANSFSF